jgi:hypothetical protein
MDPWSVRMIMNPRYPGSPVRMADGRLFTDYRGNCKMLAPLNTGTWADFDRRATMKATGVNRMAADQSTLVLAAGRRGCVDTMVPELTKRVYAWNGPVEIRSQPAGLGTGRMYLPARTDLVAGDPDALAAATFPASLMPHTFVPDPQIYTTMPISAPAAKEPVARSTNRYSAPFAA